VVFQAEQEDVPIPPRYLGGARGQPGDGPS
jgi:hypothetical protein